MSLTSDRRTPAQMILDLGHSPLLSRADFLASPASEAGLQAIAPGADWPGGKMLLIGPEGSGKSHLAAIWAAENAAQIVTGRDLARRDLPGLGPQVVVEDADGVAGITEAEAALFHLHNLILPGGRLLITARSVPGDWGLGLPDLLSRMQAAALARLDPPDDTLLSAVLVKLFADRQIAVQANLIPYLLARMERSIGAARALVDRLDQLSLARGRALTRALAAELLDRDGEAPTTE